MSANNSLTLSGEYRDEQRGSKGNWRGLHINSFRQIHLNHFGSKYIRVSVEGRHMYFAPGFEGQALTYPLSRNAKKQRGRDYVYWTLSIPLADLDAGLSDLKRQVWPEFDASCMGKLEFLTPHRMRCLLPDKLRVKTFKTLKGRPKKMPLMESPPGFLPFGVQPTDIPNVELTSLQAGRVAANVIKQINALEDESERLCQKYGLQPILEDGKVRYSLPDV